MSQSIGLSQTVNLPAKLKLFVGAMVMLTDNISVSYRVINGSISTVKHLDVRSKLLFSTIYVTFDYPKADNSLKDRKHPCQLKECVPITERTKRFILDKGKSSYI